MRPQAASGAPPRTYSPSDKGRGRGSGARRRSRRKQAHRIAAFAPATHPRHSPRHPHPQDDAMHRRVTRALPLLLAAFASAMALASPQSPAPQPAPPFYAGTTAEAVLTARRIHTLDAAHPQATAIAWDKDGRILATGEAAELRHRYPQARHIDAGDATVIPGLIDAHAHLMELGYALLRADLSGARSVGEVVQRLQAHAATAPEDAWIVGWGWDQNLWPGARFP